MPKDLLKHNGVFEDKPAGFTAGNISRSTQLEHAATRPGVTPGAPRVGVCEASAKGAKSFAIPLHAAGVLRTKQRFAAETIAVTTTRQQTSEPKEVRS